MVGQITSIYRLPSWSDDITSLRPEKALYVYVFRPARATRFIPRAASRNVTYNATYIVVR